jgi:hypothetical protein
MYGGVGIVEVFGAESLFSSLAFVDFPPCFLPQLIDLLASSGALSNL